MQQQKVTRLYLQSWRCHTPKAISFLKQTENEVLVAMGFAAKGSGSSTVQPQPSRRGAGIPLCRTAGGVSRDAGTAPCVHTGQQPAAQVAGLREGCLLPWRGKAPSPEQPWHLWSVVRKAEPD